MEDPSWKPAVPPKLGGNALRVKEEAAVFLRSLLSKNLVVRTTDGRMFRGQFMCTDPVGFPILATGALPSRAASNKLQDYNIVLSHTDEYRQPTARQVVEQAREAELASNTDKVVMNMVSRYLGLVVVPGNHIVKVEVEQFVSQMRR